MAIDDLKQVRRAMADREIAVRKRVVPKVIAARVLMAIEDRVPRCIAMAVKEIVDLKPVRRAMADRETAARTCVVLKVIAARVLMAIEVRAPTCIAMAVTEIDALKPVRRAMADREIAVPRCVVLKAIADPVLQWLMSPVRAKAFGLHSQVRRGVLTSAQWHVCKGDRLVRGLHLLEARWPAGILRLNESMPITMASSLVMKSSVTSSKPIAITTERLLATR